MADKFVLYDDLKRQILIMQLPPDSILDETTLTRHYGLSRTPVREMLNRLAGEGYLNTEGKNGTRVKSLTLATLRDLYQVAPMVYAATARLASQNYKPYQMKKLKETQQRFRRACKSGDRIELVLENNLFHELIGNMADSPYLQCSLERILIDHARIGSNFFQPDSQEMKARLMIASDQHEELIEALIKRDGDKMVSLMHDHWQLSRDCMERFTAPPSLSAGELSLDKTYSLHEMSDR